jgi:hypothetical protein
MTDTSTLQHGPVTFHGRPFGRLAWSIAGYALLLSLMLISPLFVFVPAAIFHCSIRNGRGATFGALAVSTLIAWIVAVQTAHAPGTSQADVMMGYAYVIALVLAVALPSLLVQPLVEHGAPFGQVVLIAVVLSMLGLTATEAGMRAAVDFSPGREQVVRVNQLAAQFVAGYQKSGAPSDVISALRSSTKLAVLCAPGFLLAEIAMVFVLSLIMFGRLRAWKQFVAQREGGFAPAYLFRNLSLPEWLLFAFVFGGIAPLTSGWLQSLSANVLAVTVFLYLLQGLAIFRWLLLTLGAGPIGALFAWGMVALMLPIAMLLLSIAGLFDSFFDFRKFKRKDHSDESHPH